MGVGSQLTDPKGDVVRDGYSAFDGSLFFENLPPGSFSVRLEPGQAVKLKLQLAEPVTVTIKPGGGFAGRIVVPVQPSQGSFEAPPSLFVATPGLVPSNFSTALKGE